MPVYYLINDSLREQKNSRNENHWFCYITEIFSRLGIKGEPLSADEVSRAVFTDRDYLFLGSDELDKGYIPVISAGIEKGCTVIGFGTKGADMLFGIRTKHEIPQPGGDFSLAGYFSMRKEHLNNYLPVPEDCFSLPLFSNFNHIEPTGSDIIGIIDTQEKEHSLPGLIKAKHGNAYYFCFDVAKTMWVSSQGKPIYEGSDRFPLSRTPDARVIPIGYDTSIACCDYYIYILQSILAEKGMPMLHRLPPLPDGTAPDLLLYFGGDDDATSGELDIEASSIMYEMGLPYHINVMPTGPSGDFVLNKEQYKLIKSRGHEIALHYDFTGWDSFSEEGFARQQDMFFNAFGENSICNVAHCLVMKGWAEKGRYQAALGVMGDNGRLGEIDENDINAFNLHGYAFGTTYPYFLYDDTRHGNRRISFTELPITYYEPRLKKDDEQSLKKIRDCLDKSAYFNRCLNLFLHPHYIAGYGSSNDEVIAALYEIIRYCSEKKYTTYKCGPDKLCLWWHDRDTSQISDIKYGNGYTSFNVTVFGDVGMIVKVPFDSRLYCSAEVSIDGIPSSFSIKYADGSKWLMISCMKLGKSFIQINMK